MHSTKFYTKFANYARLYFSMVRIQVKESKINESEDVSRTFQGYISENSRTKELVNNALNAT